MDGWIMYDKDDSITIIFLYSRLLCLALASVPTSTHTDGDSMRYEWRANPGWSCFARPGLWGLTYIYTQVYIIAHNRHPIGHSYERCLF